MPTAVAVRPSSVPLHVPMSELALPSPFHHPTSPPGQSPWRWNAIPGTSGRDYRCQTRAQKEQIQPVLPWHHFDVFLSINCPLAHISSKESPLLDKERPWSYCEVRRIAEIYKVAVGVASHIGAAIRLLATKCRFSRSADSGQGTGSDRRKRQLLLDNECRIGKASTCRDSLGWNILVPCIT